MAEKYVLAEKDYVKGMKYKDIAEKYSVSINTVKSWKKRYGWNRERGAPKEKGVHTKRRGAPKGNINAKGNPGGSAPKGNQNAKTHGFFSKFLPAETLEIMESMNERSAADLIWDQIQIQYAAIIRAQKVMWVNSADDHLKEESGSSWGEGGSSESFKIAFAYEQYYSFLTAQSRAMSELRSLIKQFNELAHEDDERRLKLEQMRLGIEKTKAEVDRLTNADKETPIEITIKRKGER